MACYRGCALPEQAQDGHGNQKGGEGQAVADGVAGLHRGIEHYLLQLEEGGGRSWVLGAELT